MQMAQLPSNSRLQQDELAAQLTEHGKFSELLQLNVPCPADPDTLLVSVVPSVRHPAPPHVLCPARVHPAPDHNRAEPPVLPNSIDRPNFIDYISVASPLLVFCSSMFWCLSLVQYVPFWLSNVLHVPRHVATQLARRHERIR